MKKVILLLFLALVFFIEVALLGCSQSDNNLPKDLNLEGTKVSDKIIDDFSVKGIAGSIELLQWDTEFNLGALFGKPISQHTERLGPEADTFQGSYIKEVKYDGFEIILFSPRDNGKAFYILEMKITGEGLSTGKGLKIGDRVEDILKIYPSIEMALDGRTDPANCQYQRKDVNDFKYITIEVEDGMVKEIKIYYELQ